MWWTVSSQDSGKWALPHVSVLACRSHDKPHLVLGCMCKLCPVIQSHGWSHRAVASALFIEGDTEGVKVENDFNHSWRKWFSPSLPPFWECSFITIPCTHTGCLPCALIILFSFTLEAVLFFFQLHWPCACKKCKLLSSPLTERL